MYLIKHKNITDRSLNKSNLHLNKFGSACFAKNFIKFFTTAFRSTKDIQFPTFGSSFRANSETVEVYDCPPDISPQISDNILNPAEVLKTRKGFRVGHSRANGAKRRSGRKPGARVLIPPGYLHPGKGTH